MSKNISYIKLIGAMLIFGTIGIFRKYISLSSTMLAFFRGILGAMFILFYLLITKHDTQQKLNKKQFILLVIIGILIGLNWVALFESYNHTTIAITTLCYYMEPTVLIMLSPVVFHERLTLKKIICVFISLIGITLVSGIISNTSISAHDITGIALGLLAALLYAIVITMNKKLTLKDAYSSTMIELFSASFVLIPYILLTESITSIHLSVNSILLVLIVGIIHTGFAYVLYFDSLSHLKAQSVALLSYIDPISALILSAVILNEHMSLLCIIGAILILFSAVLGELNIKK